MIRPLAISIGMLVLLIFPGCGWLEKKPYRNDPMLQSRRPIDGERIPPQNIIHSLGEPSIPSRPE